MDMYDIVLECHMCKLTSYMVPKVWVYSHVFVALAVFFAFPDYYLLVCIYLKTFQRRNHTAYAC